MKKEGTDKVTEMVNKEVRSTSRGEKCLAKFTASNGNVYGSLTLDIRKQEITRSRFLLPCVYVMPDRKSFFVWARHILWKNGWLFVITRKVVVVFN